MRKRIVIQTQQSTLYSIIVGVKFKLIFQILILSQMGEVEQHQPWTAIVLTCREMRYAALCAEGMQADVNHFLCNNKIYRVPSFGLHADLISSVFILFHLSLIEEFTRRQDAGFISQSVSNLAIL